MASTTLSKYAFLDPPLSAGDLGALGPYRVISELGRGGMGFVFRAEDTRLQRVVALKVMNEKVAATENSRRRFIEEARSMAAVKHDNVATIYEVNDQCGTPFMAMELLQGHTLEALTGNQQKFDYHKVIDYATQIARGLGAAHARGIVHRDIKPANIWIEAGLDRIKILDFGLALAQVPVDQLARRGSVIGTPQYLSPEQARAEPLDNRTDLYSLGVVLYELCTGDLPFKARTVPEQLILTLVREPELANKHNPDIPEPLARLIAKLMKKEPRHRPRSAAELEQLLAKVAVECESKSEVTLTINKLQEQLSRVTVKQTDPFARELNSYDSTAETEGMPEDVFASLPVAGFAAAAPVQVGAAPVGQKSVYPTYSAPRPASIARPKPASSGLPSWWPFAAVGVAALLMVCVVVVVFFSASAGSSNLVVVAPPPTESPQPPPSTANKVVQAEPKAASQTPPKPIVNNAPKPDIGKDKPDNNPVEKTPPKAASESKPSPDAVASNTPSNSNSNAKEPIQGNSPSEAPITNSQPSRATDSPPDLSQEVKSELPKVVQTLTVSIDGGRGADATVKKSGGREPLGGSNLLAIQTRNGVDIQHTYLRFDLKDVIKQMPETGNVRLILSLPTERAPEGSTVRVYGVPEHYRDDWVEQGAKGLLWNHTISNGNMSEATPLADFTVTALQNESELRIHDDRLTNFVRSVREEFLTLVIAGGTPEDEPLIFVSHESDLHKPPLLEIEIFDKDNKSKK